MGESARAVCYRQGSSLEPSISSRNLGTSSSLIETNLSYGVSAGALGDNGRVRAIGGVSRDDLSGVGNARSSAKRRTGRVGPGSGHTGRGGGSAGRRGRGGVGAG